MLTETQENRYIRNTLLPEIGKEGQRKLLKAKVLVVGCGGLGSPVIYYLAAAGVGNLGIIDNDEVELSNLQRQILHNQNDLGTSKVISAKNKINALNDDITITTYQVRANMEELIEIGKNYDYIIDATDNFGSRFVINEYCFKHKKTLIFGAVKGFLGQVSVFRSWKGENPCYACFNPNIVGEDFSLPLKEKGILGAVAGSIGAMQATTTVKEILGIGESLVGKILISDFLNNKYRVTNLKKSRSCQICR